MSNSTETRSQFLRQMMSYRKKPDSLDKIGSFLNKRMRTQPEEKGIRISKDQLENTLYTSTSNKELTFAGEDHAQLLVSPQGKELVRLNPQLLRRIHSGKISAIGKRLGGFESHIYQIELNSKAGKSRFALKYTFPLTSENDRFHTSGIIAMKLMQSAAIEQPVPFVEYATPVLATHDITLTPFILDKVSTRYVIDMIGYQQIEMISILEAEFDLNESDKQMLIELIRYEKEHANMKSFYELIFELLSLESDSLIEWVTSKLENDETLQSYEYGTNDTNVIDQSVISIPQLYKVFQLFQSNFDKESIREKLLSTICLVELGAGCIQLKE